MLALLASLAGFLFAGTELQRGPQSAAAEVAAETAAVRVALAGGDPARVTPTAQAPAPDASPQPIFAAGEDARAGGAATRVRIATAGIDATVRAVGITFRNGQLEYAVPQLDAGQYVGSADPGNPGNLVIGGHVSNRGARAVFARLPEVSVGDVVEVFSGQQIYRYQVQELRVVAPEATAVMAQTHDARLTLITCFPDRNYQDRLVVIGKLL